MRQTLAILVLVLLSGCVTNSLNERYGSGQIQLSHALESKFAEYLEGNPLAFAVTPDGFTSYSYYFCPEAKCEVSDYGWRAIHDCEKNSKGQACYIYAVKHSIVWQGVRGNQETVKWEDLPAIETIPTAQRAVPLDGRNLSTIRKYNDLMRQSSRRHGALSVSSDNKLFYAFYAYKNPEQSKKLSAHDSIWFCQRATKRECSLFALDRTTILTGSSIDTLLNNSNTTATSATSTHSNGLKDVRSLAVVWEGNPSPLAGTIDLKTGEIVIARPNDASCYRVDENRKDRTWKVECSDGTSAEGIYKGFGEGKGSQGVGIDQDGRSVTFTVGPRIQ
ncbi:hypothetical protein [Hwanghaeella sp.]|uniref:hypothetical protein n=1 Tax=Hwanghaeella sp. TaxID=2605943 RepID=UPI003CCC0BEC